MAALYIPTTQIPKHAVSIGISVNDISLAIAVSGIGNMFGRISFGVLSHRYESHVVKLWIICLTCSGLIMLMVPFSTKVEEFTIFMIIYGYFEGKYIHKKERLVLCLRNAIEKILICDYFFL